MDYLAHEDIGYTIVPFMDGYIDDPLGPDKINDKFGLLIGVVDRTTEMLYLADTSETTKKHWCFDILKWYPHSELEYEQRYWYILRGHPEDAKTYVNEHLISKVYSYHVLKYDLRKVPAKRDWVAIVLRSEAF